MTKHGQEEHESNSRRECDSMFFVRMTHAVPIANSCSQIWYIEITQVMPEQQHPDVPSHGLLQLSRPPHYRTTAFVEAHVISKEISSAPLWSWPQIFPSQEAWYSNIQNTRALAYHIMLPFSATAVRNLYHTHILLRMSFHNVLAAFCDWITRISYFRVYANFP